MAKAPAGAAERITNLRGRLGINQTELARLLGVSNVTVNRWEHGHTTPAASAWARLLAAEEHGLAGFDVAPVPPALPAAVGTLPTPPTTFVGRGRELRELGGLVRSHRLVSIVGPGGIGKTRLALELAGGLAADGVFFVDLATVLTDEAVPATVAAALLLPPDDATPPLSRVLDRWGSSTGVVVLDNCEHVLAEAGRTAAELLAGWPGLRILATSRAPLGVDPEVVWQTPPLVTKAPTAASVPTLGRPRRSNCS
jgi:transcriptional regulator with XRE-family HTH domain